MFRNRSDVSDKGRHAGLNGEMPTVVLLSVCLKTVAMTTADPYTNRLFPRFRNVQSEPTLVANLNRFKHRVTAEPCTAGLYRPIC